MVKIKGYIRECNWPIGLVRIIMMLINGQLNSLVVTEMTVEGHLAENHKYCNTSGEGHLDPTRTVRRRNYLIPSSLSNVTLKYFPTFKDENSRILGTRWVLLRSLRRPLRYIFDTLLPLQDFDVPLSFSCRVEQGITLVSLRVTVLLVLVRRVESDRV